MPGVILNLIKLFVSTDLSFEKLMIVNFENCL